MQAQTMLSNSGLMQRSAWGLFHFFSSLVIQGKSIKKATMYQLFGGPMENEAIASAS
jgi:hypothetical protein